MGVWHGRYFPNTSFRLYADCRHQRRSPIIAAHVAPGTEVHSDQWSAYNQVSSLPGVAGHSTVNHSLHFVDPVTGTHTQNIESYWN